MTEYPLLDAIHDPMPIYKHCTLQEIMALGITLLIISLVLFPILTMFLCHSAWLGLAIALPSSFGFTRLAIGRLGHLKQDKPYGYVLQRVYQQLSDYGLHQSPYITRVGRWSVGRH